MLTIKMRDKGMDELTTFINDELGIEAIFAQTEKEEMIGLYTTKELISPNIELVLSVISKKYNEQTYEVQFLNMKCNEIKENYFVNINDVKELLILYREMVKQEEEFKQKIFELLNKQ